MPYLRRDVNKYSMRCPFLNVPTLEELEDFTLKSYVKLLKYLNQIYVIAPFCEIPNKDTPYLILRHDIDISLPAALKMAQIERDLNIKSTYFVLFSCKFYNVLEGDNVDILKQISKLGHEIGLHYYPAQYRLYNQNPMKTLEIEIQLLEHLLGKKIYSIARHGPWDRDPFAATRKYINANHPYLRADLFIHESDRAWVTLRGLSVLLNSPPKRVQLLIHPENWQEDKVDRETLLERHFQKLKNKNIEFKEKILDYFRKNQFVIDYDNAIKRADFNQFNYQHTSEYQMNQKWTTLFRHYLINTSVGWSAHQLRTKIQKIFDKSRTYYDTKSVRDSRMEIKPLIIVRARCSTISGGYRRLHEILKRGKSEGVNYVLVTDQISYRNYAKMFPDFLDICQQYKTYFIDFGKTSLVSASPHRFLRTTLINKDVLLLSSTIAKIARLEDVDLIVGPGESSRIAWMSYLSGKICKKPWTTIFTAEPFLFQPTHGLGPLNPLNILKHVSQKEQTKKIPLMSKIGFSIELLSLLKIAEKSLILTVSPSISEEIGYLNPKIQFHVIMPGNGIDLRKFDKKSSNQALYDVVFFSRLIPEKGLFDLPEICKLVVQRFPKAKIAVAGSVENNKFLEDFRRMLFNYNLNQNTVLLFQQEEKFFIDLLSSSKVMIFPSTLDAYGLVVLEALACGTPVVAYNILAMKRNFNNVKAVLRCPIKDNVSMAKSVEVLLENEDLRKKLSHEAKEYVRNYDWKNVIIAEKEAYFKVIKWFNRHDVR